MRNSAKIKNFLNSQVNCIRIRPAATAEKRLFGLRVRRIDQRHISFNFFLFIWFVHSGNWCMCLCVRNLRTCSMDLDDIWTDGWLYHCITLCRKRNCEHVFLLPQLNSSTVIGNCATCFHSSSALPAPRRGEWCPAIIPNVIASLKSYKLFNWRLNEMSKSNTNESKHPRCEALVWRWLNVETRIWCWIRPVFYRFVCVMCCCDCCCCVFVTNNRIQHA